MTVSLAAVRLTASWGRTHPTPEILPMKRNWTIDLCEPPGGAEELERETFLEEYKVALREYTRLRRKRAVIAVGTTSDEEI